jgi:hypothetical protein
MICLTTNVRLSYRRKMVAKWRYFKCFRGQMNMKNTPVLTGIVEALIEHADWFFPEGIVVSFAASRACAIITAVTSKKHHQ